MTYDILSHTYEIMELRSPIIEVETEAKVDEIIQRPKTCVNDFDERLALMVSSKRLATVKALSRQLDKVIKGIAGNEKLLSTDNKRETIESLEILERAAKINSRLYGQAPEKKETDQDSLKSLLALAVLVGPRPGEAKS